MALQVSDLIFPAASQSITTTLTSLRRTNLSISNRLRSIVHDAAFVSKIKDAFNLPLIANERCGSWYIEPELKAGSAYFKSTDGHFGQWEFSLRRLNLQILDIAGNMGGCIIVDSTRRGKSMPDALSKTIPIWICVLNRLLFPSDVNAHKLCTPEEVVSESEHSQITARLPSFLSDCQSLNLDIENLRSKLNNKPMKPLWVTPDTEFPCPALEHERKEVCLIVVCTASNQLASSKANMDYVQGAADDSESWAFGLDAATFWSNSKDLLATAEDDLPALVKGLVAESHSQNGLIVQNPVLIKPTRSIYVANNAAAETLQSGFDIVVSCAENPSKVLSAKLQNRYLHLPCPAGKNGSRRLRNELYRINFLSSVLSADSKMLITCQTGKDLSVGIALAVLSIFCDEDGKIRCSNTATQSTKTLIKHRLSWIMISAPDVKPSRATLQSVNAFLLS